MSGRGWVQDSDTYWRYLDAPDMFGHRMLLGAVERAPGNLLVPVLYWTHVHRQMQKSFHTLEEAKASVVARA